MGWRLVAALLLAAVALVGVAQAQVPTASVISGLNISTVDSTTFPPGTTSGDTFSGFLQMAQYVDSQLPPQPVTVGSYNTAISSPNYTGPGTNYAAPGYPAELNGGKIILNNTGVAEDTSPYDLTGQDPRSNGQVAAQQIAFGGYTSSGYVTSAITNWVQAGRQGGSWSGSGGITDQAAAVDVARVGSELTGVGVVVNSDIAMMTGSKGYGMFGGVATEPNSILMAHTWVGDTTLKGYVDIDDITNVLAGLDARGGPMTGFTNGPPGWEYGDWNGTGMVTIDDVTSALAGLDASRGNSIGTTEVLSYGSSTGGPVASPSGSVSPEPGTLALLAAGALAALAVWRRKRVRD
jgi:hypothetical protein